MPTLLLIYALLVFAILVVLLVIVLVNLAVLPRLDDGRRTMDEGLLQASVPSVAVLVPARNEEANIAVCLRSLLAQDYPNLEIWIYDDASTDGTGEILAGIQTANANRQTELHIITDITGPPPGWLGKAYACHTLFEAARAESAPEYVLFTDADVRFEPTAVSRAIATARRYDAGLLSIYPRQITVTWAERLVVPMLSQWAVYDFLPLPLAFSLKTGPAFAAANGQFLLFKREAYEACGGHEAVRSQVLEDVNLARGVKKANYPALLADGGPLIQTRMYDGASTVWKGYSKNTYAFFSYSPLFLMTEIVLLLLVYVLPVVLAVSYQLSVISLVFVGLYALAVLTRLVLAIRFKDRLLDTLLHPVAAVYMIVIEVNSMVWEITGRGDWKGRGVKRKT